MSAAAEANPINSPAAADHSDNEGMNQNNNNNNKSISPNGNSDSSDNNNNTNSSSNNNNNNNNNNNGGGQPYPFGGSRGTGTSFKLTDAEYDALEKKNAKYKTTLQKVVDVAAIGINEKKNPSDVLVYNPKLYARVLSDGSLGLGEAFMEGWWDTVDFYRLDDFFLRVLRGDLEQYFPNNGADFFHIMKAKMFNRQSIEKSRRVAMEHYDLDNDFFEHMLDKYMQYSCGYWEKRVLMTEEECKAEDEEKEKKNKNKSNEKNDGFVIQKGQYNFPRYRTVPVETLDEAQELKLHMIGEKLRLQPGMRVLDVGCGWGGLAQFLCERYGVFVTGITISAEQAKLAEARVAHLNGRVKITLRDYRDTNFNEKFDRIVSVGMFEHVGPKNYKEYFTHMRRLLKCRSAELDKRRVDDAKKGLAKQNAAKNTPQNNLDQFGEEDGIFLLHTIGSNATTEIGDEWFDTYIFPNGCLPSLRNLTKGFDGLFVMEDVHNFGDFYARTISAWRDNFLTYWNSGECKIRTDESKTPEQREMFFRMFYYYLSACIGGFRHRGLHLWQVVLTPAGVPGYYNAYRP